MKNLVVTYSEGRSAKCIEIVCTAPLPPCPQHEEANDDSPVLIEIREDFLSCSIKCTASSVPQVEIENDGIVFDLTDTNCLV